MSQAAEDHHESAERTASRIVWVVTASVASVALIDLIGWWRHIPFFVGLFPDVATMKPNTAVGMLLLAAALALRCCGTRGRRFARFAAAMATLLFTATLFEYVSGADLHIDRMIADVPWEKSGDPQGRMSLGSAIAGLTLGTGLLLVDTFRMVSSILAGSCCALSLSALMGFLFDVAPVLGVSALRSMAVRTAAAFFSLSLAYFAAEPGREPTRSLLQSTRQHRAGLWFILGTCALPILLGWPSAAMYRHGWIQASFAFALLVTGLVIAQALLLMRNSQSLSAVEERRSAAENARLVLQAQNEAQHVNVQSSERRAAQSEAQYRLISDALPALVSYLDRDLCYIRVNRTYEVWFGKSASDMEGKSIEEVLGESAASVRPHLEAALKGQSQQFETTVLTLQGERTIQVSHMPDVDTAGEIRGVIVQANDVTSRRREEAALRQTEKLAAVGKLASSIAHEINNPLESVTNLLYLATSSDDVREVREYLRTAETELSRVSAIASQTLRFHKQSTKPAPIAARDLFSSVLTIYGPRLIGSVTLEERHRATTAITCMDGEIRQVLNNLVGNALDAMAGSRGRLLIRTRSGLHPASGREGVIFTVADTGSGMSAETLATIFEAFFTTKGMNGTGLGLWVSKEIIDRHAGSLQVRTSQHPQHHGTVFRLFLPCELHIEPSTNV